MTLRYCFWPDSPQYSLRNETQGLHMEAWEEGIFICIAGILSSSTSSGNSAHRHQQQPQQPDAASHSGCQLELRQGPQVGMILYVQR